MKRALVVCWILCLLLGLVGCGDREPELDYSDLIEPTLDMDITALLSEAELDDIMGADAQMKQQGVYEDGTQVMYMSETGMGSVKIHVQKMARQEFDAMIEGLPEEKEALTDLGDIAWWYGGIELFAYRNGYALEVIVTVPGAYIPQSETVSVATVVLNRLPVGG